MSDPRTEPAGLDLSDSTQTFIIDWADGHRTRIPYRTLRLACACALCIEELTGKQLLDPETVPADIGILPDGCETVGGYGVRIRWSDGHSTGIYTWRRLREM
jgi:ATP-binding protein involved in chromosome partitioning